MPGVKAAEGQIQINYAQIVDANGDPIGNPGQGAPALGFAWGNNPELNNFNIASGRPPRATTRSSSTSAPPIEGQLHVGDTVDVLTVDPPQPYKIVGIARFGTADSPAGASVVLFTPAQAQQVAHADRPVRQHRGRRPTGCLAGNAEGAARRSRSRSATTRC